MWHRGNFTLFIVLTTFILLIWGGVVHNTGSSLACPDWPLCYGQLMPKMVGQIFIEHGHRLLASSVGLMVIFLCGFSFKRRLELIIALILLVAVIVQGVLGGMTVLFKLPTIVSTAHLALSMIFFCGLIYLHHQQTFKKVDLSQIVWPRTLRTTVLIALTFTFIQMVLGAFLRHTGAGLSCGTGTQYALRCFDLGLWQTTWWPVTPQAQIHIFHRYLAIIVTLFVMHTSFKSWRFFRRHGFANKYLLMSLLPFLAVLVQAGLGLWVVISGLGIIPTTAHLAVAALLLASLWKLNLSLKSMEAAKFPEGGPYNLFTDIIGMSKPKLGSLVLLTSAVGIFLAPGQVDFITSIISVSMIALVVSGACILNCYLERDVDRLMERTKDRALPAGRVNSNLALSVGLLCLGGGLPILIIFVNPLTGILAGFAAIFYLFAYTPMKQRSFMSLFIGAVPGAIPALLGFTTVTGTLSYLSLCLFLIVFVWQIPHFMAISLYCLDDFNSANIKVVPQVYGIAATKIRIFLYTVLLLFTSYIPVMNNFGGPHYPVVAYGFGSFILAVAIIGFFVGEHRGQLHTWAKAYFYGTIIYLPLLFASMVILK